MCNNKEEEKMATATVVEKLDVLNKQQIERILTAPSIILKESVLLTRHFMLSDEERAEKARKVIDSWNQQ